jgi:hypothetical protein
MTGPAPRLKNTRNFAGESDGSGDDVVSGRHGCENPQQERNAFRGSRTTKWFLEIISGFRVCDAPLSIGLKMRNEANFA